MKIYTPTILLLALTLWGTACEQNDLNPTIEEATDYYFRVTLPDGEVLEFDQAAVSHDPTSNVYFIVAGLSECGPLVADELDGYIYIFHVPAEENNSGEELNTALITDYPIKAGRLSVVSGREDLPCVDSPSTIRREASDASIWRGSYTAQFFTYDDSDRSCAVNTPSGYTSIGEIRMDFNAPLLVCD